VVGDGPRNLVCIPGFGANVELRWEQPNLSRLYRRLGRSARLVLFDKRGTGLSDRDTGIPHIEEQVDDVVAVMDAAGVERAALFGVTDGGAIALLTAAAHPDRIEGVVTFCTFAAFEQLGADGMAAFQRLLDQLEHGVLFEDALSDLAPSRAGDTSFNRWLGRYARMAVGMSGAVGLIEGRLRLDIRPVLPGVAVPVLALHREHDRLIPPATAEYLAAHVQHGRSRLLPGGDTVIWSGDVDVIADQVEDFLTGLDAPRPR
jgi:pimeloyl-ACP methyl ester carboxylesterase